ncbi:transcription initiation factor TFIID subunit 7 [Dionaea muscipula]
MEEQFILRVPPSVAERLERLLNEEDSSSSHDKELDLSFFEDGRNCTFVFGNDSFPASLLNLPCVVESYKTYDDNVLIKTADIGQMIMVREEGDVAPDSVEYRHGLTPPMRDARRRWFLREPDLNPEVVQRVERDLWSIMKSGNILFHQDWEEDGDDNAHNVNKKLEAKPVAKPDAPDPAANIREAERSDSDDSDESMLT